MLLRLYQYPITWKFLCLMALKIATYSFLFKIKDTIIFQGKKKKKTLHTRNEFDRLISISTNLTEDIQWCTQGSKNKTIGESKAEERMRKNHYSFCKVRKSSHSLYFCRERCLIENLWKHAQGERIRVGSHIVCL